MAPVLCHAYDVNLRVRFCHKRGFVTFCEQAITHAPAQYIADQQSHTIDKNSTSSKTSMDILKFHEALQDFSLAKDIDDVSRLCRIHCQQLGFDTFIYAVRLPGSFSESRMIVINGGFPEQWLSRYWELGYNLDDPVVGHCVRSTIPIQWRDLMVSKSSLGDRIMNEAADFELRSGISMPVHSAQGELGILSLTLDRRSVAADQATQRALPYVHVLAGYVHEAVRSVAGAGEQPMGLQLTAREQACLRWAADGKTSWEIGRLLNMSERTVNFHFNNSMLKLDVSNRQHAVAKAVFQGLISPQPF